LDDHPIGSEPSWGQEPSHVPEQQAGVEVIGTVVAAIFIDPGSPWQNARIESFNGRLRDEFLNGWRFDSLLEAKVLIEDWRIDYNMNRPHSAQGDLTPNEFVKAWIDRNQPVPA
jgi:putative transposase